MRVLIIHYHLNPGGVTRIIESQARTLKEHIPTMEVVLLAGHCENTEVFTSLKVKLIVNEKLNYLPEDESEYLKEYENLFEFFSKQILPGDILHVHNLNLGKNPLLTLVISELAYKGFAVINHIHDFAEDRSDNMRHLKKVIEAGFQMNFQAVLYPELPNYFYAVLTSHDLDRLKALGIKKSRLFLLTNPVVVNTIPTVLDRVLNRRQVCAKLKIDEKKLIITYPVRVIRRKNIGEFILLAMLFQDRSNFLVTLPPGNPIEIGLYIQWKTFCITNKIPVVFEAAALVGFEELMLASDMCLTTSVQEGFGMVFLEPWLMDIPISGRNIPQVTRDIEKSGVIFPLLYNEIKIDVGGSYTDFASLSMNDQMVFISKIKRDGTLQKALVAQNPFLKKLLTSIDKSIIAKNKSIIRKKYSLKNYAKRLERLYQKVAG